MDMGEKNDRKCRWYQNDQEGLKRRENWFCDMGCRAGLSGGVFGLTFYCESVAECEYAVNLIDVENLVEIDKFRARHQVLLLMPKH